MVDTRMYFKICKNFLWNCIDLTLYRSSTFKWKERLLIYVYDFRMNVKDEERRSLDKTFQSSSEKWHWKKSVRQSELERVVTLHKKNKVSLSFFAICKDDLLYYWSTRPVVITIFSRAVCTSVRPSFPLFKIFQNKTNFKRKQCLLLARLWFWQSGSLMTHNSFWPVDLFQEKGGQLWTRRQIFVCVCSGKLKAGGIYNPWTRMYSFFVCPLLGCLWQRGWC